MAAAASMKAEHGNTVSVWMCMHATVLCCSWDAEVQMRMHAFMIDCMRLALQEFTAITAAARLQQLTLARENRTIQRGKVDVRFPTYIARELIDTLTADVDKQSPLRPCVILMHGAHGEKRVITTEAHTHVNSGIFIINGFNRGENTRTTFKKITEVFGKEPVMVVRFGTLLTNHAAIANKVQPTGSKYAVVLEMNIVAEGADGGEHEWMT